MVQIYVQYLNVYYLTLDNKIVCILVVGGFVGDAVGPTVINWLSDANITLKYLNLAVAWNVRRPIEPEAYSNGARSYLCKQIFNEFTNICQCQMSFPAICLTNNKTFIYTDNDQMKRRSYLVNIASLIP